MGALYLSRNILDLPDRAILAAGVSISRTKSASELPITFLERPRYICLLVCFPVL
jgi:hypothetical protein